MAFRTIYLTGAPASGKTSTTQLLARSGKTVAIWPYGQKLLEHLAINQKRSEYAQLREQSARLITPEDVAAVDAQLTRFVHDQRAITNIVIDSHAVTREEYGFRLTGFSLDQIKAIAPDEIWVLLARPEQTMTRISEAAEGRPNVDAWTAETHTQIQSAVAATYGIAAGCPVYYFDSSLSQDEQVARMVGRLG